MIPAFSFRQLFSRQPFSRPGGRSASGRHRQAASRVRLTQPHRADRSAQLQHLSSDQLEDRVMLTQFLVTSAADSGAGSLRAAVASSNALPSDDEIIIQDGLNIQLTSEILITDSVSITAQSPLGSSIDAQGFSRIFNIGNTLDPILFELDGLAMTGGNGDADGGGAILFDSEGGAMTIVNSVFDFNFATGDGGAINVQDGTLLIDNSAFTNNVTDDDGGAINFDSDGALLNTDLVITNTNIGTVGNGNFAADQGGGLRVLGDTVELTDVDFAQNAAGGTGGGLYADDTELTTVDVRLFQNAATGFGGVAYLSDSELTDTGLEIRGNAGDLGGGLYLDASDAVADGIELYNNVAAGGHGGGIDLSNGSSLDAVNFVFSGNLATEDGGGLHVHSDSTATLSTGRLALNNADSDFDSVGDGGAIFSEGDLTLDLVRMFSNDAVNGGALWLSGADLTAVDTSAFDNVAQNSGGGIHAESGTIAMETSRVFNNEAFGGDGGGVWLSGVDYSMRQGKVLRNEASISNGGGIYAINTSTVLLSDVELRRGVANADGGSIYADSSNVTLEDGTRIRDSIAGGSGGGVYIVDADFVTTDVDPVDPMDNETVRLFSNSAVFGNGGGLFSQDGRVQLEGIKVGENIAQNGGGVYFDGSFSGFNFDLTTQDASFFGNSALTNGGGLFLASGTIATIQDTFIGKNDADNGAGLFSFIDVSIADSLVSKNVAATEGGGIWLEAAVLTSTDNVYRENEANAEGGAIFLTGGSGTEMLSTGDEFNDNTALEGNDIFADNDVDVELMDALFDGAAIPGAGDLAGDGDFDLS